MRTWLTSPVLSRYACHEQHMLELHMLNESIYFQQRMLIELGTLAGERVCYAALHALQAYMR